MRVEWSGGEKLIGMGGEPRPPAAVCRACGAMPRRDTARFCQSCGRPVVYDTGYLPGDGLRASYHAERVRPALSVAHKPSADLNKPARTRRRVGARFAVRRSSLAALALASVAYALVPFLGIFFCPGAIMFGGWGAVRARRASHSEGFRAAFFSLCAGLLILCAQLMLWWMLRRAARWTG